ncbi:CheC-like family [Desulfamplus magnetovallimortis]|uniref:CheC-like family n=1 Tax=Desulfamplus magnetovallimortis TaxID=1246637 RepID=A0A1W1HED0_9BACT|nr:chemotaxis protein CheX [Desulfamplus magnetovallimortis]SLM30839.1 CheC-like family [Desulfamplus magnetovallimortis]
MESAIISTEQLEAIKELCNIGVGKGAAVLNSMLSTHISLNVPYVKIISGKDFRQEVKAFARNSISAVELAFKGNISGAAQLLFPTETASSLVSVLVEEGDDLDMDALRAGTFCEVGNIVLNGVMGSISNILDLSFEYSVPEYIETHSDNFMKDSSLSEDSHVLLARTRFTIDELDIEGDIALFMQIAAINKLIETIEEKFGF